MFSLEKVSFVTDHIKKEVAVESQVTSGRESLSSNMLESLKKQPEIVLKETHIANVPVEKITKKREKKKDKGEKENKSAEATSGTGGQGLTKRKRIA